MNMMSNIRLPQMPLPKTTKEIMAWLEEAVSTARKLPSATPRGYVSFWPEFKRQAGQEKQFFPPSAKATDRMVETTRWMAWISEEERQLLWQRAKRAPWKDICAQLGCDRTTAWRRQTAALKLILEQLETKQGKASTLDAELREALVLGN